MYSRLSSLLIIFEFPGDPLREASGLESLLYIP